MGTRIERPQQRRGHRAEELHLDAGGLGLAAQCWLLRSGAGNHCRPAQVLGGTDHQVEPLVRDQPRGTQQELLGQRGEDLLLRRRQLRFGKPGANLGHCDRGMDDDGVAVPVVPDPVADVAAVGGDRGRLGGPVPVEPAQRAGRKPGQRVGAPYVELGVPHVAGRRVHVHQLGKVSLLATEVAVVGEGVTGDEGPAVVGVGHPAPRHRRGGQGERLAIPPGWTRQSGLDDPSPREPLRRVHPRAHQIGAGQQRCQGFEDILRPADRLDPVVHQHPAGQVIQCHGGHRRRGSSVHGGRPPCSGGWFVSGVHGGRPPCWGGSFVSGVHGGRPPCWGGSFVSGVHGGRPPCSTEEGGSSR